MLTNTSVAFMIASATFSSIAPTEGSEFRVSVKPEHILGGPIERPSDTRLGDLDIDRSSVLNF